jgi:hypothetical protein
MEPPRILSAASFQRLIVHSCTQICLCSAVWGLSIMFNIAQIFRCRWDHSRFCWYGPDNERPKSHSTGLPLSTLLNHENERNGMLPRELFVKLNRETYE